MIPFMSLVLLCAEYVFVIVFADWKILSLSNLKDGKGVSPGKKNTPSLAILTH